MKLLNFAATARLCHMCAGGHVMREPNITTNHCAFTDRDTPQNRRAGIDHHIILNLRMTRQAFVQHAIFVAAEAFGTECDRLINANLFTDYRGFANHYAGAVINENVNIELPFNIRKNRNIVGKQHIAELVSEQIKDGDSIMLDASSTAVYVAKTLLEQGKKNLTVLTNSVEIIIELFGAQDWKVLSTGGESREGSFALVGYQTDRMLRSYHVDKAIISAKGIDMNAGLTDSDDLHANNKRTMLTRAKEKILAVDSSKFDQVAFAEIGSLDQITTIVTDAKPETRWLQHFDKIGVKCIYPK